MPVKMECPHCNKALRVTEKAFGRTVPCPSCHQPISVSQPTQPPFQRGHVAAPESSGAAENGQATSDSATALPHGMPPIPENNGRSDTPDDPFAFLRSESVAAPSSQFPAGMPPIPQNNDESDLPMSAADLLAGYRSTSKAKGFGIREKLARAVGVAKKRGVAMKLGHEARNLQTAIETQLETLGTLTLTHRPSAVSISDEIAELSRIQDGLSQKQSMLESLRQTKGSGPVVKELNKEVAQLLVCQKAVMVAVGRKTFGFRPDMAGAVGCYAALDRLQSSVEVKRGQVKAIEDEIGPVWRTGGAGLGATKRPMLFAGAAVGGLLLLCLLFVLAASFASGPDNATPEGAARAVIKAMIAGDSKALTALQCTNNPMENCTSALLDVANRKEMIGSNLSDYEFVKMPSTSNGYLVFDVVNRRKGWNMSVFVRFADGKYYLSNLSEFRAPVAAPVAAP
jgi:hypothetical protein